MTHQERAIRTVKYGFIAVGLVMIFVIIKIPVKYVTAANPSVGYAITAVALIDLTIGLLGRPFFLRTARSNRQLTKPTPVQRWIIANVCSLACIDSCLFLGFVLYILRARVVLVELLFGAAMISLLFWSPGAPPIAEDAEDSAS